MEGWRHTETQKGVLIEVQQPAPTMLDWPNIKLTKQILVVNFVSLSYEY